MQAMINLNFAVMKKKEKGKFWMKKKGMID